MRNALAIAFLSLILFAIAVPGMTADQPVVLVFDTIKGEGADKELAAAATKALVLYFKQTGRVGSAKFDRENPIVLRSIMEHELTADKVASYASRTERVQVAKVLSYQYAAGAEISIKNNLVKMKLWTAKVPGGKRDSWEVTQSSTSGGGGARDIDNAMQSATSASVLGIANEAFKNLPYTAPEEPYLQTPDAPGDTAIASKSLTATELAEKGDDSVKAGNLALAIDQYTQAVNADPANGGLRIRLAEAYARKGLFAQAGEELDRAKSAGADSKAISAAIKRVDALEKGEQIDLPGPAPKTPTAPIESPTTPTTAIAKMVEGDKLALSGKPDEAAEAYKQAISISPSDWRGYHRLVMVDVSMSLFNEALKALNQLNSVQPEPPQELVAKRYELFCRGFDRHFASMLSRYESDAADFKSRRIFRESYYASMKGLAVRLDSVTRFMEAITLPEGKSAVNQHRLLACGLLAQASSSMLEYLETNDDASKQSADIFAAQAKKEAETAVKLDKQ